MRQNPIVDQEEQFKEEMYAGLVLANYGFFSNLIFASVLLILVITIGYSVKRKIKYKWILIILLPLAVLIGQFIFYKYHFSR